MLRYSHCSFPPAFPQAAESVCVICLFAEDCAAAQQLEHKGFQPAADENTNTAAPSSDLVTMLMDFQRKKHLCIYMGELTLAAAA